MTLYEMSTWNIKDNLPRDCRLLLDAIAVLQQNEKVDAENKIAILSRYEINLVYLHFGSWFQRNCFIFKKYAFKYF